MDILSRMVATCTSKMEAKAMLKSCKTLTDDERRHLHKIAAGR